MVGLVRTLERHAEVLRLLVRELGEAHAEVLEVQARDFLVELESVLAEPGRESAAEAAALAEVVDALGLAARATIPGGYLELMAASGAS